MFLIWPEHRGDGSIAGDEHMRHGPDVMDFLLGRVPAPSSRPGIDDHPARSAGGGGAHRTVALFAPISRPIPESIPARRKPITPLSSTTSTRKYGIGSLLLEPSFYPYHFLPCMLHCRHLRNFVSCSGMLLRHAWRRVEMNAPPTWNKADGTSRRLARWSRAPRNAAGKSVLVLGIATLVRTERRIQIRNLRRLSAAHLADTEDRAAVIWTNWLR